MRATESFRDYLKRELEVRMSRNSSYSLRAFARDLKMGHARLSELLSGKKGLSNESAFQIAESLHLNRFEREAFLDQVELECSRNERLRERARTRIEERKKMNADRAVLNLDQFKLISDWYHFALLALMEFPDYREDVSWISNELGITAFQAEQALERLARLGLIETRDGRSYPVKDSVATPDGIASEAIRKAHQQLLQKAMDALVLVPVQERDFYSYILPIHTKDMPEISTKLRGFFQGLFEEYSKRPAVDRVVSLSSQLVPLTKV